MVKPTADRLLEMLSGARPASELAEGLGITRQAVQKHLRNLMREGLVSRIVRPAGKAGDLFVRNEHPIARPEAYVIAEQHESACDRVLARLRPGNLYSLDRIAKIVPLGPAPAYIAADRLATEGWITWFSVAGKRLLFVTPAGVRAQEKLRLLGCAEPAALRDILRPYRAHVLRTLLSLGEADLAAVRELWADGFSADLDVQLSKAIASLRADEIVATIPFTHPGRHRLTRVGRMLADFVPES